MKLTSVEIHPANSSEVVVLSFQDPRRLNSYNVKAIVGLDADELIAKYYGTAGDSVEKFYGLSLLRRNIVVRIELNPNFSENESYSDLRDALYKMIASSRTGILELKLKNGVEEIVSIPGFVTKLEAAHFSETPEVQITVKSKEPMLKAPVRTDVDVLGMNPADTVIHDLKSTAPHGFQFELEFTDDLDAIAIIDPSDDSWRFEIASLNPLFQAGDVLHFSSELNDRYLYRVRAGNVVHLADFVVPGSMWPILFPGDNELSFDHDTSGLVWERISHYSTYWGV